MAKKKVSQKQVNDLLKQTSTPTFTTEEVVQQLSQLMNSFVIIGFDKDNNDCVLIKCDDVISKYALNGLLDVVSTSGIIYNEEIGEQDDNEL